MNSYTFFHDKQDKKGLSCLVLLHIYVNTYLDMEEIETTACNNFLGDRKKLKVRDKNYSLFDRESGSYSRFTNKLIA